MLLDRVQRVLDKDRVIADDRASGNPFGSVGSISFSRALISRATATVFWPDCFETIERHGRLAVEPGLGADLFAAVLGVAEVLDLYLIVAACRDDDIVEFLGLLDLADGANARFGLALIEAAATEIPCSGS